MELQFSKFAQKLQEFPGQYYLRCEQEILNQFLPKMYGYFLVQLGVLLDYDLRSASTINHHVYVGTSESTAKNVNIVAGNFDELPFQYESVDVFFLPHTLEFCADREKLLSEIYNILIPGGKVIILGFNPLGIIGLTKCLKLAKNAPWVGNLIRMGAVNNILQEVGFSVDFTKFFCFKPPYGDEHSFDRWSFLDSFGKRFLPLLGGVYVVIAQKTMASVKPVKLKVYKQKIPVTRGFPEPSTHKGL